MIWTLLCPPQDCASRQELQSSLHQVEKLLSAQEASYQQSLRSLRKRLNALMNSSTVKHTTKAHNGEIQ